MAQTAAQPQQDPDRAPLQAGAERILHAALDLFGRQGVRGSSLKAIADAAAVSPALIVHHFGSKDGLRVACDEHVAEVVRTTKAETMAQGPGLDPLAALAAYDQHRPVIRYLAGTLTDGSPHVSELLDEMVEDAVGYTAEAERSGLLKPSADPRSRAVVLVLWSMGMLVLHEHLERLLGVDLIDGDEPPYAYLTAVMDIYADGVLADGVYDQLSEHLTPPATGDPDERQHP